MLLGVLMLAFNIRLTESLYPPPTEWTRTYGINGNDNEARSLVQTSDGGFAMLGFTRHYEGGWVYTSDFWLVKTDSAGNVEWNRTYGTPGYVNLESGQSVVQTDDGGYALVGYAGIWRDPAPLYDFWLIKTDSAGNMEWNQTYGGTQKEEAHSMVQTGDGGYALVGCTNSSAATGSHDYWLVKTDSTGNVMWNQTYGGTGRDVAIAWSIVQTVGEGYAMAGYMHDNTLGVTDFWLVKTCSGGDVNGDGVVDILDLSLVGWSFGSFEGEPEYKPEADLNEDGIVDIGDISIVCMNYGTGY